MIFVSVVAPGVIVTANCLAENGGIPISISIVRQHDVVAVAESVQQSQQAAAIPLASPA